MRLNVDAKKKMRYFYFIVKEPKRKGEVKLGKARITLKSIG